MIIRLRQRCERLFVLRDKPDSIALGAAIGIFFGFAPLVGLKTLLALGVASMFRANKVAAVVAVTLHDLALPIWPVVYRLEYDLGYWLIHHPHQLPPSLEIHQLHPQLWIKWSTFTAVGGPTLLGAALVGAPASWLAFLLTRRVVLARQKAIMKGNDSCK